MSKAPSCPSPNSDSNPDSNPNPNPNPNLKKSMSKAPSCPSPNPDSNPDSYPSPSPSPSPNPNPNPNPNLIQLLGCLVKFKPQERYPWFQMAITRGMDHANSVGFRAKFKQVMGS